MIRWIIDLYDRLMTAPVLRERVAQLESELAIALRKASALEAENKELKAKLEVSEMKVRELGQATNELEGRVRELTEPRFGSGLI